MSLDTMRHFALHVFSVLIPVALSAEGGCPANVKAIPLQQLNQHQMVVSVSINHSGPYDFLLDTGTQMTVVDLSLAADLHLTATGNAKVAGVSVTGAGLYARLDLLEVGNHAARNQGVLVYNMRDVQSAGYALRGLLGEDFLARYDVLIDSTHSVLCIDDTGAMLAGLEDRNAPSSGKAVQPQTRVESAP